MVSGSDFSKSYTAVLSNKVILDSFTTFSNKMVSKMSGLLSGLRYMFSTNNSSMTPPSRAQRLLLPMCEVAPNTQSRTSLEEFPPKTGRSVTRTTLMPARAAVMAPHKPASPPPTITRSLFRAMFLGLRLSLAVAFIMILSVEYYFNSRVSFCCCMSINPS